MIVVDELGHDHPTDEPGSSGDEDVNDALLRDVNTCDE
jgi:hypothetical protein